MGKRINGEGTFRKRSDGRWEARYVNPSDGKQHSIYGKTQKAVKEKLANKLHEISEYKSLEGEDLTVSEWLDIWLKNYTSNIKTSTLYTYMSAVRSRIEPSIGDITLKKLTTNDIQNLYISMKNDGIAPKTIKNIHGIIHKALAQATRLHYIKSNVSNACVIPKQERKELQVLDRDDIIRFLNNIKGDLYEDVFYVALFTGMRQGEVLGLSWSDIDFDNGVIHLKRQLLRSNNRSGSDFGSLKNGKERTIYISDSVKEVLKRRYDKRLEEQENVRNMQVGDDRWKNLVFTNENGECLKHRVVYGRYKKIVKSMGLEHSRFHDLRHSFAVISLQNGDDIKTVQEALGHYTSAFTLQTYAHATKRMREDSASRMDAFIQGLK